MSIISSFIENISYFRNTSVRLAHCSFFGCYENVVARNLYLNETCKMMGVESQRYTFVTLGGTRAHIMLRRLT